MIFLMPRAFSHQRRKFKAKSNTLLIYKLMEIVLNSYGGSLSRSNSNFLVCNDETSQLVPVYGVTAIYVWRSTRVSTDALLLALDNDIDIVLMDRRGDVKGRIWNCKCESLPSIEEIEPTIFSFVSIPVRGCKVFIFTLHPCTGASSR